MPHLDDGNPNPDLWHNRLVFDSVQKYEGCSYSEIMITPLLKALKNSIKASTAVEFSLVGEMSATIFSFPEKYTQLMQVLRDVLRTNPLKVGFFSPPYGAIKVPNPSAWI